MSEKHYKIPEKRKKYADATARDLRESLAASALARQDGYTPVAKKVLLGALFVAGVIPGLVAAVVMRVKAGSWTDMFQSGEVIADKKKQRGLSKPLETGVDSFIVPSGGTAFS